MTTEILIEKVGAELGTLDVPVELAIAATVKIMQNVNGRRQQKYNLTKPRVNLFLSPRRHAFAE